tara:strand:- start:135 stop:1241 length:1107 start_codon:yes stop_codon:yes gene_type:complete
MDTSDPDINFNDKGVCNHCVNFQKNTSKEWFPNKEGKKKLKEIIHRIKTEGKSKQYDCAIGLSGGIDSSYLALKVKDWGLRPLVIHVDAGWNSELAVYNIEKIVTHCKYDLITDVIDWEDMKNLQLAYLKAGISNQDVPQDHIFFSKLYHFAKRNNIKYILSGGNIATESIFPNSWHGSAMDAINLKAIYKRFGSKKPLKNYKTISFFDWYIFYPFFYKIKTIRPLDFLEYDKSNAINELINIGYKPYDGKHGESIFTKFFQAYYLPNKFNYDKRRPHLSSLIVSGQISRENALNKIKEPLFNQKTIENDKKYIAKKLGISTEELELFISNENRSYNDFPNWIGLQNFFRKLNKFIKIVYKKKLKIHD